MISLLFNQSALWDVLIFVAIVLVVIACIKYPTAKWFVTTILSVALIVSTCYCAIQLNYYYTASGGIYGKISGIFNTNNAEVEELTFSLKNVELVKEHEDTYSAKILNSNVIKLNGKDNFIVYVNNEPCSISQVEGEDDYFIANYTYAFYGEDKSLLCEDTLTFNFAFYTNSTYLSVSTNGGAEAVKYWNYYFNKNVFDIKLEKVDLKSNNQISINTGDITNFSDYCFVTFITQPGFRYSETGKPLTGKTSQNLGTQVVKKGSYATAPAIKITDYFYDVIYESSSIIYTSASSSNPTTQLIRYELTSVSYVIEGVSVPVPIDAYKITKNTVFYIVPDYTNPNYSGTVIH